MPTLHEEQRAILNAKRAYVERLATGGASVNKIQRLFGFKTGHPIRTWLQDKPDLKLLIETNGKKAQGRRTDIGRD